MCTCANCDYTDRFSGLPDLFGDVPVIFSTANDRRIPGFKAWPRGEPAGHSSSAAAYKAHATHCGSAGLPRPWRYVSKPPQFQTAGLVMPIPPAPKYVLDFVNSVKRPELWDLNKPKHVAPLIQLARDLRAQHRQQRKAA